MIGVAQNNIVVIILTIWAMSCMKTFTDATNKEIPVSRMKVANK
jgi:hypothetical protein